MPAKEKLTLSDQLREKVTNHPDSIYKISIAAGLGQNVVHAFLNGADSKASTLDALAKVVGAELKP